MSNFIFSRNDAGSVTVAFVSNGSPVDLDGKTIKFALQGTTVDMTIDSDPSTGVATIQLPVETFSSLPVGLYDSRVTISGSVPTLVATYINADQSTGDNGTYNNSVEIDVTSQLSIVSNEGGSGGVPGPAGPQGPAGEDGADGADGTNGTDGADGTDGTDGADGLPGGNGTDGADGQDGTDGADGSAATIAVGTTTTLTSGSSATVTNVGTSSAAVFNFGIPRGANGSGDGDGGADGADGADGLGWTGGSYAAGTGIVTFTSTDGLGFSTTDLRGADGADGNDGAPGTPGTNGTDGADGNDGAPGTPGTNGSDGADGTNGTDGTDGADGAGFTAGFYNSSTGVVAFASDDGLGFSTGDLRGADGADGTSGVQSSNSSITDIIKLTQSAYDAIALKSTTTLYLIDG